MSVKKSQVDFSTDNEIRDLYLQKWPKYPGPVEEKNHNQERLISHRDPPRGRSRVPAGGPEGEQGRSGLDNNERWVREAYWKGKALAALPS